MANTSSYFACPKESSISLLVYPILARASKTNRCNGIVTTTKDIRIIRSIRHKRNITLLRLYTLSRFYTLIDTKETFSKEARCYAVRKICIHRRLLLPIMLWLLLLPLLVLLSLTRFLVLLLLLSLLRIVWRTH